MNQGRDLTDMALATFAAGCFWGVEETFRALPGVTSTRVGYTGGVMAKPTYEDVCTGNTGHAEAVEVTYDPKRISYQELLAVFWANHNPTQRDRQGPDIGSEYRSAIFTHGAAQLTAAHASKAALIKSGKYGKPIVTIIEPASDFWPAEEYHQQFLAKRGQRSCHF